MANTLTVNCAQWTEQLQIYAKQSIREVLPLYL